MNKYAPRGVIEVMIAVLLLLVIIYQILDYTHFRQAGGRFTASDGVELCGAFHELADQVGFTGQRPACDSTTRRR